MGFISSYKKLVQLNLYHHYFLDDGTTSFDNTLTLKESQLDKYNFAEFLNIIPSAETENVLKGLRITVRYQNSGLALFVKAEETAPNSGIFKPFIDIPQDLSLDFLVYISDPLFENYSTVNAIPEIPYYFSNRKPSSEGGGFSFIDVESTTTNIEDFTISQTTYDTIKASLNDVEQLGLFGIVSLEMEGDDTTIVDGNARNILTSTGELEDPNRELKIQFKNRNTIWNFRDSNDGSLIHSSDPTALPLVKNGIVGYTFDSEERPSATPTRLIFEKDGSGTIIKTISEIYIN